MADRPGVEASIWLPLAVVGSVGAAIVHGAVCPDHFHEKFVFGLFFAVLAIAQIGWAYAVARAATPMLLMVGAVVNFAVAALWTVTRVEGLPFGLLPEPEGVGRWDLAAVAWELLVVVTCSLLVRQLARRGRDLVRMTPFAQWHRWVQLLTVASALGLVALSVSGVQS